MRTSNSKTCFLLLAGCLVSSASMASTRSEIEALQITQQEIQARLVSIEASVQNKGLLEMAQTVQRMQIELRELRGQLELQTNELEGLRKRQRELYLDIDRRLNDFQLQGSVGSAPTQLTQATDPIGGAGTQNSTAPESAAVPAETDQERNDYKSAFESLKEARYSQAIEAFTTFLKKYPNGKYADNAQYWLGEANYVSRNFNEALSAFSKVAENYPTSSKVPDAKLKMGYTHYELKQWDKARAVLSTVVNEHANSSVAPLAEQRLQRMSQEGH